MEDKKVALYKAAYEIFSKYGYKNTNIAQISQQAGISVGSFYKYYDSKEDIFVRIYIDENEGMRKKALEEISWQKDPLEVMENVFDYLSNHLLSNKILSEWNNPKINEKLKKYYLSDEGIAGNSFHQFIMNYIHKYLSDLSYSDSEITDILRVYEMVYFIDCNVTEEEFVQKTHTLKVLLTYFIRGVLAKKE